MTDDITTLTARLEAAEQETARLRSLVEGYERNDTLPPTSRQDEPTGDYTFAKNLAVLENRVDQLEARESTRAHALQEIGDKLDALKELVEKYPAVDPQDIREIKSMLGNIPCLKGCEPDPDARPSLHSIRCAGE